MEFKAMNSLEKYFSNSKINFDSPIPYYIQIKEKIKEQIDSGSLKFGDQLPGEPVLCNLFAVSRTVIRQALAELEHEGLVARKKGKGTFIIEPETFEKLSGNLTGFYQHMKKRGHIAYSQILKQEIIHAEKDIASNLNIKPGNLVLQLDRLRYIDNEPVVLTNTYIPSHFVPGLEKMELSNESLYGVIEREYGIVVSRAYRTIGAIVANEYHAGLFKIEKGDPLIVINNIEYSSDGTLFAYYYGLFRGDRNVFEVEMVKE
ncbi:MAG: GntR family transcriptional regulator [Anaerolineaceae bacterium]